MLRVVPHNAKESFTIYQVHQSQDYFDHKVS